MKSPTVRRLLIVFALILLIGNAVVSYRSTLKLIENNKLVLQTEEVISELDATLSSVREAETRQRGHIITGDDRFLGPYRSAINDTRAHIARIREMTADNHDQAARIPILEERANARLETLESNLQLNRSGGLQALKQTGLLDKGRAQMDALREIVAEMKADETALLAIRQEESRISGRNTLLTFSLANVFVLALLGFVYYLILRDIKERQRAEDDLRAANEQLETRVRERTLELAETNTELERSNRELQDFAFVASHDLQEPLRKIQAFGDRLKTKQSAQLGSDGLNYLERMQNAAGRMQTLINDLLTFSRVTTKAQPFVKVDLNRIAREVVSDLETRVQQTGGRVEISSLPSIEADALQMRQLLQNLIGNALKFHRSGVPPIVKVESAGSSNGHCQINVEDNGIGFDEKYLDRIFTPFQRLHARGEYEGTGIGLAVCRKIIERHGGNITAKSTPGSGTTFIINLPVRQDEGDSK